MIPYRRDRQPDPADYFKHLGIYAYRRSFLLEYSRWPKSRLEEMEQLEQLRVLEAGYRIRTIETFHDTIGVDTPEDLAAVEKMMAL
jgi:3-deoxy-manno-octulosonate cytidylyltransferase (CMP-KDO synthetase)